MLRSLFIYRIRNKINGKAYIGWTVDPKRRWKQHQRGARNGLRNAVHLAIAKYGVENFTFEIIEEMLGTIKGAHTREIEHIKREGTFWPGGYNLTRGGDGAAELGARAAAAYAARKAEDPEKWAAFVKDRGEKVAAYRKGRNGGEIAKRMWANRSPEMREAMRAKMQARESNYSAEYKSARARKGGLSGTPEERSARGKAARAKMTPEGQRAFEEARAKALANFTPEKRSEIGRKGLEARLAKYTPEQRRASSLKTWETRRKRAQEKLKQPLE